MGRGRPIAGPPLGQLTSRSGPFVAPGENPTAIFLRLVAFAAPWRATGDWGGVKTATRFVTLLLVVLAVSVRAQSSLENARRAQAMFGPEMWSEVISVRNETRGGTYPATVHALVFEFAGILWFYTDRDGTQSFSLHQERLAEEKADFLPLLRDIEPGFTRWEVAPRTHASSSGATRPLPNGCFIESVVAFRTRVNRGDRTENPRLLSYYSRIGSGRQGHTVLAYEVGDALEILDPAVPEKSFKVAKSFAQDPLSLARRYGGKEVLKARFLVLGARVDSTEAIASARTSVKRVAMAE